MMENVRLPRSNPEDQGIPSAAVSNFLDDIEKHELELHSFMLLRHGAVAAEGWWSPYTANLPHMLFSLSKSFTSSAIGLAVSEGLISPDDRVVSFFPDEAPAEISNHLQAMRISHLLMMGTGHAQDTTGLLGQDPDHNWVRAFLRVPVEHEPGTHFVYNSGATYMLSAILHKVTGQNLLEYLRPRLMEPLGIHGATWETCPRGINIGGWGLSVRTEDIAVFGQLYLQKGVYQGRRILPETWIEEATAKQIFNGDSPDSDWTQGYGYQFWRCRHEAYRGDGAFGQFCIVMPKQDAVMAITSGLNDMQGVLNAVWRHLVPAMQSKPVPGRQGLEDDIALKRRLASLAYHPPQCRTESLREQSVSRRVYRLEENEDRWETFSLAFDREGALAVLKDSNDQHEFRIGRETWQEGSVRVNQGTEGSIVSSFTWRDADTLEITVRLLETPFVRILTCRFDDSEGIELEQRMNVGPGELLSIKGRAL